MPGSRSSIKRCIACPSCFALLLYSVYTSTFGMQQTSQISLCDVIGKSPVTWGRVSSHRVFPLDKKLRRPHQEQQSDQHETLPHRQAAVPAPPRACKLSACRPATPASAQQFLSPAVGGAARSSAQCRERRVAGGPEKRSSRQYAARTIPGGTCQYLEEQRSMQLFSPTDSSPSLYLSMAEARGQQMRGGGEGRRRAAQAGGAGATRRGRCGSSRRSGSNRRTAGWLPGWLPGWLAPESHRLSMHFS